MKEEYEDYECLIILICCLAVVIAITGFIQHVDRYEVPKQTINSGETILQVPTQPDNIETYMTGGV